MQYRYIVKTFIAGVLCLPAWAIMAPGAELSIGATTLAPGGGGTISVAYASQGNQVSGLQFDLGYDGSNLSVNPVADSSLRSAGKGRYYADQPSELHRLMIAGWNQTALTDGSVFTLFVNVSPNASQGAYNVTLTNVVGVDPSGNPVPVSFGSGVVNVSGTLGGSPAIQSSGILNGGSLLSGSVSPGEIVTLIGSAIGPATAATLQLTPQITVSTTLNNTQVTFDGTPAPLLYAGLNQINALVPFEISGQTTTAMTISQNGQLIGPITIPLTAAAPAILTQDGSGTGAALALNPDLSLNTTLNAAPAGSMVTLYLVGAGQSTPTQLTGAIDMVQGTTNLTVTATVAGLSAKLIYAGPAPSLIAGATQVNFIIPSNVAPSPAVPVSIQVGSAVTPTDVFISVSAAQ